MGWLRLVGSSKLMVSFAKETYKRDDILQKRPRIVRSLLIVATHNRGRLARLTNFQMSLKETHEPTNESLKRPIAGVGWQDSQTSK